MKTFGCICGNTLFFENVTCIRCGRDVGYNRTLRRVVPLEPPQDRQGWAVHPAADPQLGGVGFVKDANYDQHGVSNELLRWDPSDPWAAPNQSLAHASRFNSTIPDLSIEGNLEKWRRLERAKRRLFYTLDGLGLPYGHAEEGFDPPLCFEFLAEPIPPEGSTDGRQRPAEGQQVFTGHANGTITINLKEADPLQRERERLALGERQRTLIGHFRHEIGHYFWDLLIRDDSAERSAFDQLFGDPFQPGYGEALQRHYEQGPPPDWPERFLSSYASMHPWEDFAETFGLYLDMHDTLETAEHFGLEPTQAANRHPSGGSNADPGSLEARIGRYQALGIAMNEMNRAMGLLDLVPEVLIPPVQRKLGFLDGLVARHRRG